jgi:hypothetical protein
VEAAKLKLICIVLALWLAILLIPDVRTEAHSGGERRQKFYPGVCPNDQSWYLVDSDDTTVVVGCYDPDYQEQ